MTLRAVINEIREGRRRLSCECGHDPAKLIAYLQQYSRRCAPQIAEYRRRHPSPGVASPPDEPPPVGGGGPDRPG